ncbi:unnamed protein product [Rotaria sp. Silwood1]|nr:unnamed protein product [Rotaria sp. Silwood1]CAF1663246.1 unnamed protein product [Rotaria sp. Silwood1]
MTFGNYVLFNLIVAIPVEGFSTEKMGNNFDTGSDSNRYGKIDPFKKLNKSSNSNNSSLYKSIIKICSSQLQSLSSSTTQSFHTCIESMDK